MLELEEDEEGLAEEGDDDSENEDQEANEFNALAQDNNWNKLLNYFDPADQDSLLILTNSFRVKNRRLKRLEEVKIIARAQNGDLEARQILVEAFFGLVLGQVLKYRRHHNIRSEHPTLSVVDLVQEGWIGFFHAVKKWQEEKGCRLSTYAMSWIYQAIRRTTEDYGRTIRIPVYRVGRLNSLLKVRSALEAQLGRTPTDQELAKELGISETELAKRYLYMEEAGSLQAPLSEADDAGELGDMLPDKSASPVRQVWLSELQERVATAVLSLSVREQEVLNLRYGLVDGQPLTLRAVALRFTLTRERIRQIEKQALENLGRRYPDLFDGHTVY